LRAEFEEGEIAIFRLNPGMKGEDCEITDGLKIREMYISKGIHAAQYCYDVRFITGLYARVRPDQLQKQPPYSPRNVTTWDDCPWRPSPDTVTIQRNLK